MNLHLAPLEGITTYIYRRAYNRYFGNMDRYYIPFISLSGGEKIFNHKEKAELSAENNSGMDVIPQVITNSAADVLSVEKKFKDLGYEEININLGCPSGTVTSKGRGSGMLRDAMKLDAFLAEIFEKTSMRVSIKTRIGYESPEEWEDILKVYNKYPVSSLIIHPRVRADFYKNTPHLDAFMAAVETSENPLCYNGDIYTVQDYLYIKEMFPQLDCVMLGRGVLTNPFLAEQIRAASLDLGDENKSGDNNANAGVNHESREREDGRSDSPGIAGGSLYVAGGKDAERLEVFHDEVFTGYKEIMSGDKNTLFKMKEFWHYMVNIFPDAKKHDKKIKKMNNCKEYAVYVKEMFRELSES